MKAKATIKGWAGFTTDDTVEVDVGALTGTAAAEWVFAKLNHGSGQELEGYRGRSMSVGDSVEVPADGGGTTQLRCEAAGWKEFDDTPCLPASSACDKKPWCVRQLGHEGSCSATFLSENIDEALEAFADKKGSAS